MSSESSSSSDEEWSKKKSPPKRLRKVSGGVNGQMEGLGGGGGGSGGGRRGNAKGSSTFIQKVFDMASCKRHGHAIGFSDDGMSLEIRNASLLGPVLSQYFRHGHTSSFIRQLNNYGFKTISSPSSGNDRHVFAHPHFKRDDRILLESITRKAALREKKRSKADVIKELQEREYEQQNRMLQLEARHHELMQRTVMLDAENKSLKAMFQTIKTSTTPGGNPLLDEKRLQLIEQQQHHHHYVQQQQQQQHFSHPHLQHNHQDQDDDFFPKSASVSPTVMYEHHHHPHHGHLIFSQGNNPNSPISGNMMDGLHVDIVMSPMDSSASPEPTSSSSHEASPSARMDLCDMDLGGEDSRVVAQA
jgi:hypothetical protein